MDWIVLGIVAAWTVGSAALVMVLLYAIARPKTARRRRA